MECTCVQTEKMSQICMHQVGWYELPMDLNGTTNGRGEGAL